MEKHYLLFKEYKMSYQVFGSGKKILFAFHGFGKDANDFKILEPSLGKDYKIISFDLFYHGKSDSPANPEHSNFKIGDLKGIINQYLIENNVEQFSLLAYSLGGRICLQLIELFEDNIDTVFLFAPDGMKYSWGYNFVTRTNIGRNRFKKFIKDPHLFFFILRLSNKSGLVKNSVYKFLNMQLDTEAKRQKVFDTHLFFRNIHPDLDKVKAILNSKNIKLHLFFGRHDTIIPSRYGKEFIKGLNDKTVLHILESGHHLIKESVNVVLNKIINKP